MLTDRDRRMEQAGLHLLEIERARRLAAERRRERTAAVLRWARWCLGALGWVLAALALTIYLMACAPKAPPAGPGEPAPGPSTLQLVWDAAWPHLRAALLEVGRVLVGHLLGASDATGRDQVVERSARAAAASVAAGPVQLVRSWSHGRIRLGTGPDGSLRVVTQDRVSATQQLVRVEDADGRELWRRLTTAAGKSEWYRALPAGDVALVRDGRSLVWGDRVLAIGAFEAYAGLRLGDGSLLAFCWEPCTARPCPAVILRCTPGECAAPVLWARELFGVAMALDGPDVWISSREQPNSSGWTLRRTPLSDLLSGGTPQGSGEAWRPGRDLSLEDPLPPLPAVTGGAARRLPSGAWKPSGRVYHAEPGGALRLILQAASVDENAEPASAEFGGILHVAATLQDRARSSVWRWESGGLVRRATVPGVSPSLAVADGVMWVATSLGLWRWN